MKEILCLLGLCLSLTLAASPDGNELFNTNFNDGGADAWNSENFSLSTNGDKLRAQQTGTLCYGKFWRYFQYNQDYRYLQITVGSIENMNNTISAINSSAGNLLGRLFSGINTFDLNAQKNAEPSGSFALTITQSRPSGTQIGAWADYKNIVVSKIPINGLTISLLKNNAEVIDGQAQVGDKIQFRYYAPGLLPSKELELKIMSLPKMQVISLSNQELILKDQGHNIYSATIAIDETATNCPFSADAPNYLVGMVKINNDFVYGTATFCLDLKTNNTTDYSAQLQGTPFVLEFRKKWVDAVKGVNLAKGKKVVFSRKPTYSLTAKGGTDEFELTDGILSNNLQEHIWFNSEAIGWYLSDGAENGVNLLIDLGKVEEVKKLVFRCLGGIPPNTDMAFPRQFTVYVSKDGEKFYPASSMIKLNQGERDLSDFKKNYYLEENSIAYVYPFEFDVNAEARYVCLTFYGTSSSVFADELAVMQGRSNLSSFNHAYNNVCEKIYTSGIVVKPRINTLGLIDGVRAPSAIQINDMRNAEQQKKVTRIAIELPVGINLTTPKPVSVTPVRRNNLEYNKFIIEENNTGLCKPVIGGLFFEVNKKLAPNAFAVFYAECEGVPSIESSLPITVVDKIQEFPPLKRLHSSLAWTSDTEQQTWPDFLVNWRMLGFNAVSTFPRYWSDSTKNKNQKFLFEAKKMGFKVVMNESPDWMEVGAKDGAEVFSQIPGAKNRNLCPSYRGAEYQKEMARIYKNIGDAKPDYIFWDIECYANGATEAAQCTRCSQAWKKSGKAMGQFLKDLGVSFNGDLYRLVEKYARESNTKIPIVASYDRHASPPEYALIDDFNLLYPKYLKYSQPSLYISGNAQEVHDAVRAEYRILKNRDILPWLTAGCYGEFEPYKIEQMVLESFLNGSIGVTYYCYGDFDSALDYYYHAKAIAEIAPYEDLIADGEILEPKGSNDKMTYSGIKKGDEMLFLIGNYSRTSEETTFTPPFTKIIRVKNLRSNQEIKPAQELKIKVPKGDIALFWIKGQN